MKRTAKIFLLSLPFFLGGLALPTLALASFTPYQCTVCSGDTAFDEVSYSFKASGTKAAANWAVPVNRMFTEGNYLDRINTSRTLVANSRVARIGVYNSFMETEWLADSVLFGVDGYLDALITGDASNGFGWSYSRTMNSTTAGAVILQFFANNPTPGATEGYEGFDFSGARVCCHPSGTSTPSHILEPMERMDGLLLGANDVIFVKTPAASTDPHKVLTLWRPNDTSNNYVVYGRCNANPTTTTYDFRSSTTSSASKIIHFPTNITCNGYWHIAVNAWSYASGTPKPGNFSMTISHHIPERHYTDFRVGFTYTTYVSATNTGFVLDGIRRLFGATEGAVYIENVTMFAGRNCICGNPPYQTECDCNDSIPLPNRPWTANCATGSETIRACDLTIADGGAPAYTSNAGEADQCISAADSLRQATIYKYLGNPRSSNEWSITIAHELGHSKFCQQDEYITPLNDYFCGHTIMNCTKDAFINNICFDDGDDACTHGWNGSITNSQWAATCYQDDPGGWDVATTRGVAPSGYYPTEDPDQYDYVTPRFTAYPIGVTYEN